MNLRKAIKLINRHNKIAYLKNIRSIGFRTIAERDRYMDERIKTKTLW